jgi:NAD(P)-dependent dehydrogenase (short-subunit alcohol dehydrogenase family)
MSTAGYLDRLANLSGRVAVVVGGGAGIGRGVSLALAEAGVDLVICDIDVDGLKDTCEQARAFGVKVVSAATDATVTEELSQFFDLVERERPSGVDILVNVVGGVKMRMFADSTRDQWEADIQRNYGYALESMRRVIDLMRRRGGGSIINFTTIEAHRGAASFAVYAGAKAGLMNFTRALAVELAHERIRVNCLAPDTTPSKGNDQAVTPELQAANAKLTPEQVEKMWALYVPRGVPPSVEELAKGVLFLASDLSSAVTGITLHVDAGTNASMGFLRWPYGSGWLPTATANAAAQMFPVERLGEV